MLQAAGWANNGLRMCSQGLTSLFLSGYFSFMPPPEGRPDDAG
jgi:hypothetical protein